MACQSQRGLPLFLTNDHISSISASASPARSRSQAASAGCSVRSKVVFTDSSVVSFFLEFPQHGVGTDMQRARRITYPTGIETHVDDHVLHFRQASAVAIVEQKTALGTQGVL